MDNFYQQRVSEISLGPSDIALDCGAHVGNVTELLSQFGCTVHAFEPNPYAFEKLSQRVAANPKIMCWNKAVLAEASKVKLYLHENAGQDQVKWASGSSILDFKGNVNQETFVEVDGIDLTQFILDLGEPIKLIKLDVEGAECPIINKLIDSGAIDLVRHLWVETHDEKIPELREETNALRERVINEGLSKIRLDWL